MAESKKKKMSKQTKKDTQKAKLTLYANNLIEISKLQQIVLTKFKTTLKKL